MLQYFPAVALSIGNSSAIVQQMTRGYNLSYISKHSVVCFLSHSCLPKGWKANMIYEVQACIRVVESLSVRN